MKNEIEVRQHTTSKWKKIPNLEIWQVKKGHRWLDVYKNNGFFDTMVMVNAYTSSEIESAINLFKRKEKIKSDCSMWYVAKDE